MRVAESLPRVESVCMSLEALELEFEMKEPDVQLNVKSLHNEKSPCYFPSTASHFDKKRHEETNHKDETRESPPRQRTISNEESELTEPSPSCDSIMNSTPTPTPSNVKRKNKKYRMNIMKAVLAQFKRSRKNTTVRIKTVKYKRFHPASFNLIPFIDFKTFNFGRLIPKACVVGLPTMAPSIGLDATLDNIKSEGVLFALKRSNFLVVIDEPNKSFQEDPLLEWVEFALGDVFKLDISQMKSMDDYTSKLSRKGRWNFKDRQKKFNNASLICSEVYNLEPFMVTDEKRRFISEVMWPLYKQTGEKNGFTVLKEEEFLKWHTTVGNLTFMLVWDISAQASGGVKKLCSFCSGVKWRNVMMPLWCGSDYENMLTRKCSTYYNMLYNYIRIGIEDPSIDWIDLGASHRVAKSSIGFKPYSYSGYILCKRKLAKILIRKVVVPRIIVPLLQKSIYDP